MGSPFIGEIRMFGGNFAPAGWNFCDGSILSIAENDALFNLIGTTYGGDGQSTFAVPDLRSRVPIHTGGSLGGVLGQQLGTEAVTLTTQQIPLHRHGVGAGTSASLPGPAGNNLGNPGATSPIYHVAAGLGATQNMASNAIGLNIAAAQFQPHDNMQPYLCVNYIISLFGIFPSQS